MTARYPIERIEARILDIPTIRPHKLSFGAISRQSPVIVQLWLANGACGFGEAATIGGPSWNEESPESIKHAIDGYLAPALIGQDGGAFGSALTRMDAFCKGNHFAKSAVEMALIGMDGASFGGALARMDAFCKGNYFAKSAVEMALIDAYSRTLGLPAYQLLGG